MPQGILGGACVFLVVTLVSAFNLIDHQNEAVTRKDILVIVQAVLTLALFLAAIGAKYVMSW